MRIARLLPVRNWIACMLIAGGFVCVGRVGIDVARTAAYQMEYRKALHAQLRTPSVASAAPSIGEPIGWLEIPRLGVSAAVVHGDTDALLKAAIGHLPDTPLPWSGGNSALAGHRDTFFRPLRHIRVNDVLRFKTAHGEFQYRVRDTFIVDPEDLSVLERTPEPVLTLITCYPFDYVGSAPRRFIVRAERIEAGTVLLGENDS